MMLLLEQLLNGLQYGALLFMLAAGLTLIFGIMGVVNLTHGSFYMVGAYAAAWALGHTQSFAAAAAAALLGAGAWGLLVELAVVRRLYRRDHLYQVLATFGLILFTNELTSLVFGRKPPLVGTPAWLDGAVTLAPGLQYPVMRLAFIVAGLLVAFGLWLLVHRTRLGMQVRAGADDREMIAALGVDIGRLYTVVFALGALLCGLAGVMAAPLLAVEIGMGEKVLITTFVVIVVGGVGSVRGAALGALMVGMVDSLGRAWLPVWLGGLLAPEVADPLAAGLAAASIYVLMAVVLIVRPLGLLPMKGH